MVREEVQDIVSAREAGGGAAPMHIGAVKGKGKKGTDVTGKGRGDLMQAEKERDDAKNLAEKSNDRHSERLE